MMLVFLSSSFIRFLCILRGIGGVPVVVEAVAVDDERVAQPVKVTAVFGIVNIILEKQLQYKENHVVNDT